MNNSIKEMHFLQDCVVKMSIYVKKGVFDRCKMLPYSLGKGDKNHDKTPF